MIKKFIIASLFILLQTFSAAAADSAKPIDISAEELNKMINDKADIVIIDARYGKLYEDGHIKGAISLPADEVNALSLAKIAPDVNEKLVFYCADEKCPASRIAAAKAIGAGYRYVYEFAGGYAAWHKLGYSSEVMTKN